MSSSKGERKKPLVIGEGVWRQNPMGSLTGVWRSATEAAGEGVRRQNPMLKRPRAVAKPKVFLRPNAGPLDKNAYLWLRRRKLEIGCEKEQLDVEEANVDKWIALLEQKYRFPVQEGEQNIEESAEDTVTKLLALQDAEEDEETFSCTRAAAEEEARAAFEAAFEAEVESAAAEAEAAFCSDPIIIDP